MKGTINQLERATQIKTQVNAEFDRVARALDMAARKRAEQDRADIHVVIAILEDKRAEVLANDQASYFIHDWLELRGQVREMITGDSRFDAVQARRAAQKLGTPWAGQGGD